MEFKSHGGMVVKNLIVTGGELDITDAEGLYFIGCDFEGVEISCVGGEGAVMNMASGCCFIDCEFHDKILP